jgi:biotin operon repressor
VEVEVMAGEANGKVSGWYEKHAAILKEIEANECARLALRTKLAEMKDQVAKFDQRRAELLAQLDEGLGRVKKKQLASNAAGDGFVAFKARKGSAPQKLLSVLDDLGTASSKEIAEELKEFSSSAILGAIQKLRSRGAIETLANGSYALTDAQQKSMRGESSEKAA